MTSNINIFKWVFFILFFFPFTTWAAGMEGKMEDKKHIYTVIEFESTFMNRKEEKVLKILGEPDKVWEHRGKRVWTYNQAIKDQDKLWDQNIMFDFGRVNMMWGNLPTTEEDK